MSCEVCEQKNPKYKCPGCSIKTCSLHCVKRHKATTGCSGVRDKTAYMSMKDFSDRHLLSDYRFLEDVDRKAYSAITDDLTTQHYHSGKFNQLRKWCKIRKTWLKLLPPSFSRHKENTSWVSKREKKIYWRVHWKFPQSDAEYVDESVREDQTLYDILATHLDPVKGDPVHRQRLKRYCHRGLDELQLYMKVEGRPANSVRYHKLDGKKTLQENLAHKSLIEFPTIHVVLKESAQSYEPTEKDPSVSPSQPESSMSSVAGSETRNLHRCEGAAGVGNRDIETQDTDSRDNVNEAPAEVHAGKGLNTGLDVGAENAGKDLESPERAPTSPGKEVE